MKKKKTKDNPRGLGLLAASTVVGSGVDGPVVMEIKNVLYETFEFKDVGFIGTTTPAELREFQFGRAVDLKGLDVDVATAEFVLRREYLFMPVLRFGESIIATVVFGDPSLGLRMADERALVMTVVGYVTENQA